MEQYEPTKNDLLWGAMMLAMMTDNSILTFPTTMLIYRISHKERTMTLLNSFVLDQDEDSAITHRRSIRVFGQLGYMILVDESAASP